MIRGNWLVWSVILMAGSFCSSTAAEGLPNKSLSANGQVLAKKSSSQDAKGVKKPSKTPKDDKDDAGEEKDKEEKTSETVKKPKPPITNVTEVTSAKLVDGPKEFLNKNVRFTSEFFAYSNLALGYKPAFRDPKKYISFLVYRPNSKVPYSELKLAMLIPDEKDPKDPTNVMLNKLKVGDTIEVTGKVFSTALDEPWIDVLDLKRLKAAKPDEDEESDEDKADSSDSDKDKDKDKDSKDNKGKEKSKKEKDKQKSPKKEKK
ncbi:MAG: hypothetical protein K2Z81_22290 [Cyanobacteria bacterium]|nr:hypothetical protein [Cyanobacteriota bacterium]